jgi:hypothetical protein
MKSSTAKITLALAVGLITAAGAARADNVFTDIGHGTAYAAKSTWHFSKDAANTVVHSPVIAYEVVRGERPLFPHNTAARDQRSREQMALTGHRTPRHYDPPI